jgi:hypothetical protein
VVSQVTNGLGGTDPECLCRESTQLLDCATPAPLPARPVSSCHADRTKRAWTCPDLVLPRRLVHFYAGRWRRPDGTCNGQILVRLRCLRRSLITTIDRNVVIRQCEDSEATSTVDDVSNMRAARCLSSPSVALATSTRAEHSRLCSTIRAATAPDAPISSPSKRVPLLFSRTPTGTTAAGST